jgi:hypothetical protein
MRTSTKAFAATIAVTAMTALVAACGGVSGSERSTTTTTAPPTTTTAPPTTTSPADQPPLLEDGEWFGFVTTDSSGGVVQLLIDPAEMLSGQKAHDAAVEAGYITEDEDLPNDFFIANPDDQSYLVPVAGDATITVLSGEAVDRALTVSIDDLASIFDGTYEGEVVYGILPGILVPFDVTIVDGEVTVVAQVYTP